MNPNEDKCNEKPTASSSTFKRLFDKADLAITVCFCITKAAQVYDYWVPVLAHHEHFEVFKQLLANLQI